MCGKQGSLETTVRERRDERGIAAGVFDAIANQAISGYDRIIGLDLSDVAADGKLDKKPLWRQGNGQRIRPDRAKSAMEVVGPYRQGRNPLRPYRRRCEPQRLGPFSEC